MVYAQSGISPGEWGAQSPLGFWDTNRSPNLGQTSKPYNNQPKKKKEFAELWILLSTESNWKKVKRKIST